MAFQLMVGQADQKSHRELRAYLGKRQTPYPIARSYMQQFSSEDVVVPVICLLVLEDQLSFFPHVRADRGDLQVANEPNRETRHDNQDLLLAQDPGEGAHVILLHSMDLQRDVTAAREELTVRAAEAQSAVDSV